MSARKSAPAGAYPRRARRNPLADCPLTAAFAAIGGKWKLTIVYWLAHGEQHFSGLQRRVAPISHKVLTEQLRELEADRIVERVASGAVPAPVHYHLSDYGRTVLPLVETARAWGAQHLRRTRDATAASGMDCAGSLPGVVAGGPDAMKAAICPFDSAAEYDTPERCFINELSNTSDDPDVSIARARVAPGITTRWHRLRGIAERYVILEGSGRVEVGDLPDTDVGPGDVVRIPPGCRQRIANTGSTDLVFLAICSPRFVPEAYEDIATP